MKKVLLAITLFFTFTLSINALTEAVIDITKMDIFELQEAVDNDLINYETITRIYLDRINEYDKNYKAVITINDKAIDEAKKRDEIYKTEGRKSIIFGMPIIVKDNIDVQGMPTTAGAKSLKDNMPNENAKLIQNLIDKGAIIIGKSNMSEFAFMASSSVSSYGTVKNAYNTNYSSYGSSGGSAVSVATYFASLGIGTDTNMSVRGPSSANNLYGMRPTFNSVSSEGIIAYDITRDTAGPITRTAKENAVMLAVMKGENENKYINDTATLEGKRIGVLKQFIDGSATGLDNSDKEVKDLFYKTVDLLKENGVEIIEIANFYNSTYNSISNNTVAGWTMCYAFNNYIKNTTGTIRSFNKLASSSGHIYSLWGYTSDCSRVVSSNIISNYDNKKVNYKNAFEKMFKDNNLDAVMYPTLNNKLLKVGTSGLKSNAMHISPVLGVPDITIPMGSINELYYGFDLISLKDNEQTLYDIAISYNEINNTYKLPDIVPNLYEIKDEVNELKELYLKNRNNNYKHVKDEELNDEYNKVIKDIKNYFINYSEIENKIDKAKELTKNYNDILTKMENYKPFSFKTYLPFALGLPILILLIIPKKKHKRA